MGKQLLLLASLGIGMTAKAQQVTTYAGKQYVGSGNYNATPNNALTDEYFSVPHGIGLDTNGRIWVTDQHNIHIFDGTTSRNRGGYLGDPNEPGSIGRYRGTGSVSRFATPRGIYAHPKTNDVYICDSDNSQIRSGKAFVNSSTGTVWDGLNTLNPDDDNAFAGKYSFAGTYADGAKGSAGFASPEDLVITSNGTVYIADYGNDVIRKIASGNVSTLAGKGQTSGYVDAVGGNARFEAPSGICLENDNSLLVADRNNGRVRRVNLTTGAVSTVVSGLTSPSDVVYAEGLIFIADNYAIKVWDGTKLRLYAGKNGVSGYANGNDSSARFGDLGLMIYRASDKSLYVCDRENNVVRRVTVTQAAVPDFTCTNVTPTVGQTVILRNKSKFWNSITWSISPGTYTLQSGSKLTDTAVYVSFSATGSYSVTLTATNSTGSVPLTRNNYINVSTNSSAKPAVDFLAVKTMLTLGDTARLVDLSANTPTKWDWTITPRKFNYVAGTDSTSQNPRVKFTATGTYSVTLKATNGNGFNSLTKNAYITVAANSTDRRSIAMLAVYPNPTTNVVYLKGIKPDAMVQISMADGKMISRKAESGTLDLSDLPAGVYFIRAEVAGGYLASARVLKVN